MNASGNLDYDMAEAVRQMIQHKLTKDGWSKGMNEMTGTGAVAPIAVPTWVSKKKFGSPAAVKGSKSLGYKVVKDISKE